MTKYEICVVLSQALEENERQSEIEKIKAYITRFGGEVEDAVDEWGKKRLAYEIKHMKEGYYYFIKFNAPKDAPKQITEFVRIMENVIRFLITKRDAA